MLNSYLNDIRKHIDQIVQIGNISNFHIYDVSLDEVNDPFLLSYRIYNTYKHYDVVLIACGVNGIWEPLPKKRIVLPLISHVLAFRKKWDIDN